MKKENENKKNGKCPHLRVIEKKCMERSNLTLKAKQQCGKTLNQNYIDKMVTNLWRDCLLTMVIKKNCDRIEGCKLCVKFNDEGQA